VSLKARITKKVCIGGGNVAVYKQRVTEPQHLPHSMSLVSITA